MEVVKIRLQAQQHSLADPLEAPRYRNAGHAVYTIVREEGMGTLYRGVSLTALRQATNQGRCGLYVDVLVLMVLCRCEFYGVSGD
jgi:solute carrier family 25 citrate transporter 1